MPHLGRHNGCVSTRHFYELDLRWTGDRGTGTAHARAFGRDHELTAIGPPPLFRSADPAFRGDAGRGKPEQLLVGALAQCHMLTYLWLAALEKVVVRAYEDTPTGTMLSEPDGSGQFVQVTLRPVVTDAAGTDLGSAESLHTRVGDYCFIARSVNFPVHHDPTTRADG
jgi:organic hydroperoxide reductase OsmC/OhrA